MLGKGHAKHKMRTRAKANALADRDRSRGSDISTPDPPNPKRSRKGNRPGDGNGPAILAATVSTKAENKEILATVPAPVMKSGGIQAEHSEYSNQLQINVITKAVDLLEDIYDKWVDTMPQTSDARKGAFIRYMQSSDPDQLKTVASDAGISLNDLMEGFICASWQDYMSQFSDTGAVSATQHSETDNLDNSLNNESFNFTVANAVQILNDMYDNWLSDNSRSSNADTSIKAFIAYCHCSDPACTMQLPINVLHEMLGKDKRGKIRKIREGLPGQYHYRIQGSLYHLFNHAAHPIPGESPSYAQMFFLDTQEASTLRSQNPCNAGINCDLFREIENELKIVKNPLRDAYKMMWQIEEEQEEQAQSRNRQQKRVTLVFSREETRDRNDLPPTDSNEVAAVYVTNAEGDVPHSYVTVYDKDGYRMLIQTLLNHKKALEYPKQPFLLLQFQNQ
ncbi:hypothetical protein DdX_13559 [Ditylenchus destructor]|uniref:Uncharacterized protein n=1 Tax=Ditylenchus destructor TaxID=166010 RepID=A0AAD4MW05_9BILA|nr:hypothetical protein DdX_13559 [Ditylenchus destructor]